MSEHLLNLRVAPRLPRRYEDTKPALNQAFTHVAILGIGGDIAAQNDEKKEKEKQESLQVCEQEIWQKAELYKNKCVDEAIQEVNLRTLKTVDKIENEHEKVLRNETSRVEGIMNHWCLEKVNEERVAGEKKLNDVVAKLYANFAIEKEQAMEQARIEEQKKFDNEKKLLKRDCQAALEEQRNVDAEQTLLKLEEMRNVKEEEKNKAIEETVLNERKLANERLQEVVKHYENVIANIKTEMKDEQKMREDTEQDLKDVTLAKESCMKKMTEVKQAFLAFVEKSRPDFSEGQADYLIPQIMFDVD